VAGESAVDDEFITSWGRLVEAYNYVERRLGRSLEESSGVPSAWFEVLLRLARADDGQLSMSALADQVALTTGGITRLLDRMIAAGLVDRRTSTADRRVALASLTAAGRKKVEAAAAVHARDLREVFAPFSPQERHQLDELLDRLRAAPRQVAADV
jgi:MarR family transcriptional regulator, 2-MHQ and catechol-resistance regulon repressor